MKGLVDGSNVRGWEVVLEVAVPIEKEIAHEISTVQLAHAEFLSQTTNKTALLSAHRLSIYRVAVQMAFHFHRAK